MSLCRYFCMMYISLMLFITGVAVAKTIPLPPFSFWRYRTFMYRSKAFWLPSLFPRPEMLVIFVL